MRGRKAAGKGRKRDGKLDGKGVNESRVDVRRGARKGGWRGAACLEKRFEGDQICYDGGY